MIEKNGFFYTPEDWQYIDEWINSHEVHLRVHLWTAAFMAWNLAAKTVDYKIEEFKDGSGSD